MATWSILPATLLANAPTPKTVFVLPAPPPNPRVIVLFNLISVKNVLNPPNVCASLDTKPGFVPFAGCKVKVDPEILAPFALGAVPTGSIVETPEPPLDQVANPLVSEVNTFPAPGVPPVILI